MCELKLIPGSVWNFDKKHCANSKHFLKATKALMIIDPGNNHTTRQPAVINKQNNWLNLYLACNVSGYSSLHNSKT